MGVTAQSQLERDELDSVVGSGIFNRAPNLSSFLSYICEQYFAGASCQIKEYNIAVEALGRPSDFNQKKDSIVRVEAHRLRKRLSEYYASAGADHALRIEIPNGQYAPVFVQRRDEPLDLIGSEPAEIIRTGYPGAGQFQETSGLVPFVLPPSQAVAPSPRRTAYLWIAAFAVAVLAGSVAFWPFRSTNLADGSSSQAAIAGLVNPGEPVSTEFRMLAGYRGKPFTDRLGHKWEPDSYFTGGAAVAIPELKSIEGLPDPELFRSFREGTFRYDIPLRPGTFELHLLFAETILGKGNPNEGEDVRSFRVNINGQQRLDLFDAMSEAGAPNRLQVKVFKDIMPATDGKLHLEFIAQSGQPLLNGLEILASVPDRIRPIRIVAQKSSVTDADGRFWSGDQYVSGGHLVERHTTIDNFQQKNLYLGERFGNFTYRLPVAPGKYRLRLHFAETYLGSKIIANAPPYTKGARLFTVSANGTILLHDFDVTEAAGGTNLGVVRTFEGLEPNAQGLIILEFSPSRNYACVNAIELEETN